MNIAVLDSQRAFEPGSRLWITFAPGESKWTCRMDWYLNFAIARWENHRPMRQPPELKAILLDEELDLPESSLLPQHPLLISSREVFPNQELLVLPKGTNSFQQLPALLQNLQVHSARVFLADSSQTEEVQAAVNRLKWSDSLHLGIVPRLAATSRS